MIIGQSRGSGTGWRRLLVPSVLSLKSSVDEKIRGSAIEVLPWSAIHYKLYHQVVRCLLEQG